MSASHADTVHDHHGHADAGLHFSLKGYAIGFVLSVILTAIPFWLVMNHVIASTSAAKLVLLVFAAVQVVVHMIYFLHLNTKAEGGWTFLATIFTIIMVAIVLAGSIWVMYHLDVNMMPGMMHMPSMQQMRTMP